MNFANGRLLVVDLLKKETEEIKIEDLLRSLKGGYELGAEILKRYPEGEPLIIGTGILTASFFPASSMGVVLWKNEGIISCVPLNWFFPVEFKLTGFDFLLIKNSSPSPVRLWIRDGICDILDAEKIWGEDVWKTMDFLKDDHGDENIHALLIGNEDPPSISQDYWGGFDSTGGGVEFKKKNLKAIAVRGMGSLNIPDEAFRKFLEVPRGKEIERSYPEEAKKRIHRKNACFNCGLNCYPFFMLKDEPSILKESTVMEPGFLSLDPSCVEAGNLENAEGMLRKGIHPYGIKKEEFPSSFMKFVDAESSFIKECLGFGICPFFAKSVLGSDISTMQEFERYLR